MRCEQQESSAPQTGFLQSLQNLFKQGKPKGALVPCLYLRHVALGVTLQSPAG